MLNNISLPRHTTRWKTWLARVAPLALLTLVTPACEDLPAAPNVPPMAEFVYSPVSPIIAGGTGVTFNASGSRDSDGSITSYAFDFGDGTAPVSGSSSTVNHVFRDTAARCIEVVYTVLLTVTDDQGDTGTASQQVTVIELPQAGSEACR
jgi:PKD repeat protein